MIPDIYGNFPHLKMSAEKTRCCEYLTLSLLNCLHRIQDGLLSFVLLIYARWQVRVRIFLPSYPEEFALWVGFVHVTRCREKLRTYVKQGQ